MSEREPAPQTAAWFNQRCVSCGHKREIHYDEKGACQHVSDRRGRHQCHCQQFDDGLVPA